MRFLLFSISSAVCCMMNFYMTTIMKDHSRWDLFVLDNYIFLFGKCWKQSFGREPQKVNGDFTMSYSLTQIICFEFYRTKTLRTALFAKWNAPISKVMNIMLSLFIKTINNNNKLWFRVCRSFLFYFSLFSLAIVFKF